jgi:hypothetical protein
MPVRQRQLLRIQQEFPLVILVLLLVILAPQVHLHPSMVQVLLLATLARPLVILVGCRDIHLLLRRLLGILVLLLVILVGCRDIHLLLRQFLTMAPLVIRQLLAILALLLAILVVPLLAILVPTAHQFLMGIPLASPCQWVWA